MFKRLQLLRRCLYDMLLLIMTGGIPPEELGFSSELKGHTITSLQRIRCHHMSNPLTIWFCWASKNKVPQQVRCHFMALRRHIQDWFTWLMDVPHTIKDIFDYFGG